MQYATIGEYSYDNGTPFWLAGCWPCGLSLNSGHHYRDRDLAQTEADRHNQEKHAPHIARVQITPPDAIDRAAGVTGMLVTPVWEAAEGIDRPDSWGWSVTDGALAGRLSAALLDGVAHEAATIRTDADGRTYVEATWTVFGKYMDEDLDAMGY